MALTMTRTRTQTTLTKLAEMVANVHGELAFLDGLLQGALTTEAREMLHGRWLTLGASRDALYATLIQFDPRIDPSQIGILEDWRKQFGRNRLSEGTLIKRYVAACSTTTQTRTGLD
jgi:hypothetical protein